VITFEDVYKWPNTRGKSSISKADCNFLRELCIKYQPSKILEFGTGSGKSTWAMALSSQCKIHTIDRDDWYSAVAVDDKIHRYIMYSTQWLDTYNIDNFDFVFIDAFIPEHDYDKVLKRIADSCSIVVHDYSNTIQKKGYRNVNSILKCLLSGDFLYDYNLTTGGECCAHLRVER